MKSMFHTYTKPLRDALNYIKPGNFSHPNSNLSFLHPGLRAALKDYSPLHVGATQNVLRPLDEYKAIGFDVDHCLVRNKAKEIFPLLCNCLYRVLVDEKGYPESMFEFGVKEKNYFMNGLVIDLKLGHTLKLGEDKLVLRAYHGFDRLSQKEIVEAYGSPPIFKIFDPTRHLTDDYYACLTFFECYFPLVFAKMLEFKKQQCGQVGEKEIQDILADATYAVNVNYKHYDDNIYRSVKEVGYYYKSIINEKEKYLVKHDKMLEVLKTLKEHNKVLFLVSDSHYEFVEILMDYAYGEGWQQYFDFVIVNARKSKFFVPEQKPFVEIDLTKENRMGDQVTELEKHKMYTGGNVTVLEENIDKAATEAGGHRVLYTGDNYPNDILAAKNFAHWDTVCVMEELENLDLGEEYDERIWGDWQYEETPYGTIPSFWLTEMMTKADKVTSGVDSQEMLRYFMDWKEKKDSK